ncbi:MAG: hypothetical protein A2X48_01830 [Lentisphaerae bacterium GWF2_49_21]|nr:MAG: hypothetical protein A2X48_01830 [Lentisphaerae bacterium GWF2_49_21]
MKIWKFALSAGTWTSCAMPVIAVMAKADVTAMDKSIFLNMVRLADLILKVDKVSIITWIHLKLAYGAKK